MVQENPQVEKPEVKVGDVVLTPDRARQYQDLLKAAEQGRLDLNSMEKDLQVMSKRYFEGSNKGSLNLEELKDLGQDRALFRGVLDEVGRRKGATEDENEKMKAMLQKPKADTGLDRI